MPGKQGKDLSNKGNRVSVSNDINCAVSQDRRPYALKTSPLPSLDLSPSQFPKDNPGTMLRRTTCIYMGQLRL